MSGVDLDSRLDKLGATIDEKMDALCDEIDSLRAQLAAAQKIPVKCPHEECSRKEIDRLRAKLTTASEETMNAIVWRQAAQALAREGYFSDKSVMTLARSVIEGDPCPWLRAAKK